MFQLQSQRRRGFTLIELMVVIGIIALLMSILGVAVMNSLTGARITGTKALMTKIQRQLQTRMDALQRSDVYQSQRDFQGGAFLESVAVDAAARRTSNPPATPVSRVPNVKKVLAHKALQRQFLPQTWAEARYLLERAGKTAPSTINPLNESAEVLYFFLNDSSIVGYTPSNQDLFSGSEARDTDGNGFPELIDSWGRPVRFYRWPTRLLRPTGFSLTSGVPTTIPQADFERAKTLISALPTTLTQTPTPQVISSLNHDPDDALNLLTPGNGWLQNVAEANAVEMGSGSFSASPFPLHTVFTWHTPLVVSAGPDGEFGIFDSTVAGQFGRLCQPDLTGNGPVMLNDNITTHNIKSGGN